MAKEFKTASQEYIFETQASAGESEVQKMQLKGWMTPEEAPVPKYGCGFQRSRPGIPSIIRTPFQSDGAHHSNLMAPGWCRLVGQFRHVMTVRLGSSDSALCCRLVPV
jgi:hypothetical protein